MLFFERVGFDDLTWQDPKMTYFEMFIYRILWMMLPSEIGHVHGQIGLPALVAPKKRMAKGGAPC